MRARSKTRTCGNRGARVHAACRRVHGPVHVKDAACVHGQGHHTRWLVCMHACMHQPVAAPSTTTLVAPARILRCLAAGAVQSTVACRVQSSDVVGNIRNPRHT